MEEAGVPHDCLSILVLGHYGPGDDDPVLDLPKLELEITHAESCSKGLFNDWVPLSLGLRYRIVKMIRQFGQNDFPVIIRIFLPSPFIMSLA